MARLAHLRCFAFLALSLHASALQSGISSHNTLLFQTADPQPSEPFELTAYSSVSDESYSDDVYASDIDTHMPEDLLQMYPAFDYAELQQDEALLQQQEHLSADPSIFMPQELPGDFSLIGTLQYDMPQLDSPGAALVVTNAAALDGDADIAEISSDLVLMSRLAVGLPLQQAVLQPITDLAVDAVNSVWAAVQNVNPKTESAQQDSNLQDTQSMPSDSSNIVSSSSSMLAALQEQQQDGTQDPMGVEISIRVESTKTENLWSRLRSVYNRAVNKQVEAAADGQRVAMLAGMLAETLGRKSGVAAGDVDTDIQDMAQQLDATGSFSGSFDSDDMSAAAAAAVAAAAASVMSKDPNWEGMDLDIQLTQTTQKLCASWGHLVMLGVAMLAMHVGLCMLLAPLYVRFVGRTEADEDSEQQQQPELKQFIVSSGLKEAGVYKHLLSEQQEV